jgi:putative ABC transport system substrate-binding protein
LAPGIYGERTMREMLEQMEAGARNRQVQLQLVEARGSEELAHAFSAIAKEKAHALIMLPSPIFFDQRKLIVDFATKHRLPSFFLLREWVELGGLLSYGPNLNDLFRRAATYIDKILKGAKPADLPVEQPAKFELVINLKTAKALGLTIPPTLLVRADEVIE